MATEIPPWLSVSHDPVGAYIRSYAIGAQIGEAQTRIAEQQRQANMEHAARQEQMQANILKAQQEMLMEKAYKDQQLSLESARLDEAQQKNAAEAQHAAAVLEETKRRNMESAILAAASLKERETFHEGQLKKKQVMHYQGGVKTYDPQTGTVETISDPSTPTPKEKNAQAMQRSEAERAYSALEKLRAQKTAAETEPGKKLSRDQMKALNQAIWNADLDYREAAFKATNAPPSKVPIPPPAAAPAAPPTTTAQPALPMPSKKSDLVAGKVYQTSRGRARWDGEKFVSE